MFHVELISMLSLDFVYGFVSGCALFSERTAHGKKQFAFQIKTTIDNHELLEQVALTLNLKNHVYDYVSDKQKYSLLLVRDRHSLINIIIPLFDNNLYGHKSIEFNVWKSNLIANCSTWNYRNIKTNSNPQIN